MSIYRADVIVSGRAALTPDDAYADVASALSGHDPELRGFTAFGTSGAAALSVSFTASSDTEARTAIENAARAVPGSPAAEAAFLRTGTGRHHRRIR